MAKDFLTTIRLPRVAALPGSANTGDCVVLDDGSALDGITHVYNGSAWIPLGVTSKQLGGFISESTANFYELSAAGAMPGAADFVAVVMCVSLANRNGAAFEPIFSKVDASLTEGWYIAWSFGQVEAYVKCSATSVSVFATTAEYNPNLNRGHLLCVGLRVWSSGGDVFAELWIGPAMYSSSTAAGQTVVANTADAGRALASALTSGPSNAVFAGLGYYAGTVTTAQMREIMGRCVAQATIPEDVISWTSVYQGQDVDTAPATWTPSVGTGTMAENGTCEGVAGFFPPGAAGNNVIVGGSVDSWGGNIDGGTPTSGPAVVAVDGGSP